MNPFPHPTQWPRPPLDSLRPLLQALTGTHVTLAGMRVHVPGPLSIRLAVVMGNLRMQRLLDTMLQPGATVVDIGANIGYNTLYMAHCVGHGGRVYALEPAQDNLSILYANLFANRLTNVQVLPYAAGSSAAVRRFFLRGEVSAVNSFFQDNFYAPITAAVEVLVAPLDDLISGTPDVVKIDVEGAELEVLQGMTRMLQSRVPRLIVEWHPTLQRATGYAPDALPRYLLDQGFSLRAVSHTCDSSLKLADVATMTAHLLHTQHPIELVATR